MGIITKEVKQVVGTMSGVNTCLRLDLRCKLVRKEGLDRLFFIDFSFDTNIINLEF